MKKIVVMPGGFHPFHAGHYALYKSALDAFPDADVYVAATNDQKERPFPFSIKEKLAKVAGVEPSRFIQVKSPFKANEVTDHYDPQQDVLIFVRSEKDRSEQPKPGGTKKDGSPAYFQPWTGKDLQPFSKHAYIEYLPTVEFGPGIKSATEIRNAWPNLSDEQKQDLVKSLYPKTKSNEKLLNNVVQLLDMGMSGQIAEDWQKVNKKDRTAGMSRKAVKAYRRENPGSKLQTAVTTKPGKLKKGSKASKRRKSFCARMTGMKKAHASAKTKRDPNSPINKALRRWNCESVEQLNDLAVMLERKIKLYNYLKEEKNKLLQKKSHITETDYLEEK